MNELMLPTVIKYLKQCIENLRNIFTDSSTLTLLISSKVDKHVILHISWNDTLQEHSSCK
jgi:hypothetical protein